MKIEANYIHGHPEPVSGDHVRFVSDDGRTMFEVRCVGISLEVRAVDVFKDEAGNLCGGLLDIRPRVGNVVHILPRPYEAR